MALPYSTATSGQNAIADIQKMLRKFGCKKFATGEDFDTGELFIQFEHRGRMVNMKASSKGYAAAWIKENPWSNRRKGSRAQHEAKALEIGAVAVCSILRDWVKGQVTAIEIGMLSFEGAFLSHIMLPSGMSVIEHIEKEKMLPAPTDL
jgi:hypothetical protein